ncbi:MAG TPA: hypothetical protein DCS37_00505 [Clostridiales bacterium]|nr:hypothetical protein [Clostridiales bacterium]
MYTRCPSCRAEISFEPPANMESLPDGYKHRIKCPSCGVTIGVKINKIDTTPATLVQQAPAYTQPQTNFEPVYANEEAAAVPQSKVKAKHSGIGRNVTMMIMSLIFIALSVVGYLVNADTIKNDLFGISWLDGITCWDILIQNADAFSLLFEGDVLGGILTIIPMILFTLAGINFIVALVSACGKKYGRAYNLIMSIVLAGLSVFMLFYPFVCFNTEGEGLLPYLRGIVEEKEFALFVSAGLGLLQLILGLCFCKSLKRKEKKVK